MVRWSPQIHLTKPTENSDDSDFFDASDMENEP